MRLTDEGQLHFLSWMVHRLMPVRNVRPRKIKEGSGVKTYTLVIYYFDDGGQASSVLTVGKEYHAADLDKSPL